MTRESFRFEPVRMLLPSEEVARRLADAVRSGHFRVGERLPSERGLAEQFELSRPTVREAVRLLVEAGILSVKAGAGGGIFVASERVPFDLLVPEPQMRPGEMSEILELRRLILPWVAQTASLHAEDDDYDRMREAIAFGQEQLHQVTGPAVAKEVAQLVVIASMRFDLAMARATRNGLVLRLMDMLLRWVEPLRLKTLQTRRSLALAVSVIAESLTALESGDQSRIAEVIDKRLRVLEEALEQHTGRVLRRNRARG
jgi:GntR family transcriptional repressor for pyruvate dehydrogenase complex